MVLVRAALQVVLGLTNGKTIGGYLGGYQLGSAAVSGGYGLVTEVDTNPPFLFQLTSGLDKKYALKSGMGDTSIRVDGYTFTFGNNELLVNGVAHLICMNMGTNYDCNGLSNSDCAVELCGGSGWLWSTINQIEVYLS